MITPPYFPLFYRKYYVAVMNSYNKIETEEICKNCEITFSTRKQVSGPYLLRSSTMHHTKKTYKFLQRSQWWTSDQIKEYQWQIKEKEWIDFSVSFQLIFVLPMVSWID
jgi:hypothetical protein